MDLIKFMGKLDDLSIVRRRIIRTIDTSPLNLSINKTQENVLMAILKTPRNNMTDLSVQVGIEKSSLTRVIDSLIEEGLVMRTHRLSDRRTINCVLTEKGMDVANRIDVIMREHLESKFSDLSEEEKDKLFTHLSEAVEMLFKSRLFKKS
ncbi:MAG: MarR family transcriptional regulator [Firmicutes bacterium]|nr:MarR family transcriptional regulator [Bacillota bacterium]